VGKEPRSSGSGVEEQGSEARESRDPDQIKQEIHETREEMGETVEALAGKADVKAQARQAADERKERLKSKAGEVRAKVRGATPEQAQQSAGQLAERARREPMPFAVGGAFAAGLVLGILLKRR
jgi:ElaB/YqjD/DUF883 family membrane-anchored ribosome-binding protein